jgi:phenylacetate-CoA ligase
MSVTRLEGWIRTRLPGFQPLYDLAPYPVKNVLASARGLVLARMRHGRPFRQCLEDLLEREKWTAADLEKYRDASLRRLLSHAYNHVPYYRRAFASKRLLPSDIKTAADLPLLPVLDRETVRDSWADFVSRDAGPGLVRVFTSGTTGAGLTVVYDREAYILNWAFRARQKAWAGVGLREWRISLFGSRVAPMDRTRPPFWAYNYLEKQILLSIYHVSAGNRAHYVDFFASHPGLVVEGFPSVLSILATFIEEDRGKIGMRAVFTDGEPLEPAGRRRLASALSCPVYDSYGMTEWVGLIQECERGGYHMISDYAILEVLDGRGDPVPPGEEGYLVWTGFTNTAMPLIRYRIGDKGMWRAEQACPCGRPFPLVHPTITREGDYLIAPDGRILSPRIISPLARDKTSFGSCQFIQQAKDAVEILVVPKNGHAAGEADDVRRELQKIMGRGAAISIRFADRPARRPNGKIPLIFSWLTGAAQAGAMADRARATQSQGVFP